MKVNLVMQGLPCCGPKKNNLNGSNNAVICSPSFGAAKPDAFVYRASEDFGKKLLDAVLNAKKPDGRLRFPNITSEDSGLPLAVTSLQAEVAKQALSKKITKKGREEYWLNSKNIRQLGGLLHKINDETLPVFKDCVIPRVKYGDTPLDITYLLGIYRPERLGIVKKMLPAIERGKVTFHVVAQVLNSLACKE